MAEEKNNDAPAPADGPAEKKGLPIKAIIAVLVVLLIEGAAISAAFLMAGGPQEVKADAAAVDLAAQAEQPVEVLVIADKFQNTRSGRSYIYDTEVYIVVRRKHEADVTETIENMNARISTDIAEIFRKAAHTHLLEPELSTLRRQISAALTDRLQYDEEDNPLVMEVVIPKCKQYRADP